MPTLEERLAAKVQAGATPPPATPTPGGPLTLEQRLAQKAAAGGAAPPIPNPPSTPQPQGDDQPGYWRGFLSQINPLPAIEGMWEGAKAQGAELSKMSPGQRALSTMTSTLASPYTIGKNMAVGAAQTVADIGSDVGKGHYRTAAGKTAGIVIPIMMGYGSAKGAATLPKAAALTDAEQAFSKLRVGMSPTVGPVSVKNIAKAGGKQGLVDAYTERMATQQAARQAARQPYSQYDKTIKHVKNTAPAGTIELRPAEFAQDASGAMVMKKPAVTNATDWHTPVPTAPFRKELEELIALDAQSVFPAGHPIRKFLDKLGEAKGYDYLPFDDLKKAMGKLSVYARQGEGGLRDAYQGLALKILEKAKPVLTGELKKAAKNARFSQKSVTGAMEAGDVEWAKYSKEFRKLPTDLKKGKALYERQEAMRPGKSPGIQTAPNIKSVGQAVGKLEGLEEKAGAASQVRKVAKKAESDVVKHLTSNPTNLEMAAEVLGPNIKPELLTKLVDDIHSTRDWGRWSKLDPHVVDSLTAHAPDLRNSITDVFSQLAEAERVHGAEVAQSTLRKAITMIQGAHGSKVGRALIPKSATIAADALDTILSKQDTARKLNQALRTQVARLPLTTKVARGIATTAPTGQVLRKAAEIPPPPTTEKMAGE